MLSWLSGCLVWSLENYKSQVKRKKSDFESRISEGKKTLRLAFGTRRKIKSRVKSKKLVPKNFGRQKFELF